MRRKGHEFIEALEGRFNELHAAMVKLHSHHIDTLDKQFEVLNQM